MRDREVGELNHEVIPRHPGVMMSLCVIFVDYCLSPELARVSGDQPQLLPVPGRDAAPLRAPGQERGQVPGAVQPRVSPGLAGLGRPLSLSPGVSQPHQTHLDNTGLM